MANFLSDKSFLLKVNQYKVREYQAAILVLDFETENPIARLEGKVVSGNMTVAANSPVRRTCSLTVVFDSDTKKITDINNLISVDKKISLSIGFNNPFYHTEEYRKYGDTLWFKQGVFFITKASSSISTSGATVTVELQDKMAGLNGTVGGTLPASVSFHDRIIVEDNGDITTEYPLIKEIIQECVHHFGGEHFSRISIEDVPDVGRIVVSYKGNTPMNFQDDTTTPGISFVIGAPPIDGFGTVIYNGDNAGYMETPLTYPGELIMKAGTAVTGVLDEIVKMLGNYEYFYDEEGIFHFRRIPFFSATGNAPLNFDLKGTTTVLGADGKPMEQEINTDQQLQNLYLPRYNNDMYINEFATPSLVTQVSFNPNYGNLKNDFICWGTKNGDNNTTTMVRYHLAVDTRPKDIRRPNPEKYEVGSIQRAEEEEYAKLIRSEYSLCHKDISEIRDTKTDRILRYEVNQAGAILHDGEKWGETVAPALDDAFAHLGEDYWFNWREELYRKALLAYGSSTDGSYYDEELLAEWRNIFDPTSTLLNKGDKAFQKGWEDHYGERSDKLPWSGYKIDVKIAPEKLHYWLDLIDTDSAFGQYSVSRIGRRSKVTENSKINVVFDTEIPDIVFIENDGDLRKMQDNTAYYISIGQRYCFVSSD